MADGGEDEAARLAREYAAWGHAAVDWLDRVGACVQGRLMPGDVASLKSDFELLAESLRDLGRRLARSVVAEAPPVDFAALEHRIAELQIPALCERILKRFPAPGAAGREEARREEVNLPAAVDLLLFLEETGPRMFHRRISRRYRQKLCADLAGLGLSYHRRVMDGFVALGEGGRADPGGSDLPGTDPGAGRDRLRNANFDQIRMDLLHWLLEALGDRRAAEQIRHLSRITARTAVRHVDREITAYLETHDPSTRMRLRPVLEAVDEAIALIRAVLPQDAAADGEAGGPLQYFVRDLGEEVATPFVRHMGLLVIALFEDLQGANARRSLTPAALRGGLQRMEEALAFCRLIDHPMGRDAYARAIRVIRRRGDALVQQLGREVAAVSPENGQVGNRQAAEGQAAEGQAVPVPGRAAEARAALIVLQEFVERWRQGEAGQEDDGRPGRGRHGSDDEEDEGRKR
ncbi:hypothetical protein ACFOGJ_09255 [Marinibaculum pumilum]|uniref:DUF1631 family protein n=1 Tax=Marinibaculum pumilum TaxID=1766165 RepID=A0ABV7KYD1_9PROT